MSTGISLFAPADNRCICYQGAFLGIMIFLMRRHYVNINILPEVMNVFTDPQRFTLVHMILAEVFRSLSACSRGHDFFGG